MRTNLLYYFRLLLISFSITAQAQQPVEEWARRYDSKGATDERQTSRNVIAVDAEGNSYITGNSTNSNTTSYNIVTVKYYTTGEELWASVFEEGIFGGDVAIAVDDNGGVYITTTTGSETEGYAYVTIRYDAATGEQSWSSRY